MSTHSDSGSPPKEGIAAQDAHNDLAAPVQVCEDQASPIGDTLDNASITPAGISDAAAEGREEPDTLLPLPPVDDISQITTAVETDGNRQEHGDEHEDKALPARPAPEDHVDLPETSINEQLFEAFDNGQIEDNLNSNGEEEDQAPERQSNRNAERLAAWNTFVKQHDAVVAMRVQADELRRRSRFKRQDFLILLKDLTATPAQLVTPRSDETTEQQFPWTSALTELENLELLVEEAENELVQAETSLKRTLPQIFGSEDYQTFDALEANRLYLDVNISDSTGSKESAQSVREERSVEQIRLAIALHDVSEIEDQLLELRDDKDTLRNTEGDLTAKEMEFLESYPEKKTELRQKLSYARSRLEEARHNAQQQSSLVVAEEEQDPEDVKPPASAASADGYQIVDWLTTTEMLSPLE